MNTENPFYINGLNFSCKKCSCCCRGEAGFVYLSRNDLANFLAELNMEENFFIEKYCRWVPYYDGNEVLCLKEKDNFDCIFWENGCVVYNARPLQCSSYPFWDFLLKDKKSWDNAAKTCPGMNNGEFHSYEEINKTVKAYRQNIPLKKSRF
ncbi:MAG: YkgJ family cysteine cluster protein [Treponema sp.]|nr:YkgJ family cysteine cluster protein [Treponema sp.]